MNYGLYAKPYAFAKMAKAPWLYGVGKAAALSKYGKFGKFGKFGKYPFGVW